MADRSEIREDAERALSGWRDISCAPKDGTEIVLWYADWLGEPLVVSGHWLCQEGREFEATWEHSLGYGDATMWQPLPAPPTASTPPADHPSPASASA